MQINPISSFTKIPFKGKKDENQPLSMAMKDIFADQTVSCHSKRTLWNLSEVPFFYGASRGMSREDLLKLADLFERQDTNILQMAIDGDVKIATGGNDELNFKKYLSLEDIAKHNRTAARGNLINLYNYILSHPVFRIIQDVREQYSKSNVYPQSIPYETQTDEDGNTTVRIMNMREACSKAFVTGLTKGKILDANDTVIMFDKKIVGKNDVETAYERINPASIEPQYPVQPETLKAIYRFSSQLPAPIMRSIYDFGESDFFPNLIKNTNPLHLLQLAQFDVEHNYLISRMFNEKITMDTLDPETDEYIHRPIIDTGRILKGRKEGTIKESDFLDILLKNTMAFQTCALYRNFKEAFPDKEPQRILLHKAGENLEQVVSTKDNETFGYTMNASDTLAQTFLKMIEKLPYKRMIINFAPE